jgi:hypothetical protein
MTDVEPGANLGRVNTSSADFHVKAEVTHDGRAKINLHNLNIKASKLISQRLVENPPWKIPIGEHLTKNNKHSASEFKSLLSKCSPLFLLRKFSQNLRTITGSGYVRIQFLKGSSRKMASSSFRLVQIRPL